MSARTLASYQFRMLWSRLDMRFRSVAVTVACLVVGGVAATAAAAGAGATRVRWRGLVVEGRTPPSLQSAVAAHVAVALRSLGSSLVTSSPEDAEAAASCAFPSRRR